MINMKAHQRLYSEAQHHPVPQHSHLPLLLPATLSTHDCTTIGPRPYNVGYIC